MNLVLCLNGKNGKRYDGESESFVTGPLCSNGKAAGSATQQDAECGMAIPIHNPDIGQKPHQRTRDGNGVGRNGDPMFSIQTRPRDAVAFTFDPRQVTSKDNRTTVRRDGPCGSLHEIPQAVVQHLSVRRLTPTECERLQGFPDGHTRCGADGKEISDSQRYRMLGNAVAVPCAEWIGRRIVSFTD